MSDLAHPSAQRLADYVCGEVDAAERESLQDHLADCAACARIVLDLAGEAPPEDAELDRFWTTLAGELPPEAERRPIRLLPLAAAVLLLLGGFLAGRIVDRLVPEEAGPGRGTLASSASALDLVPRGYLRDNGATAATLRLEDEAPPLVLRLLVVEELGTGPVKARILGPGKKTLASVPDLASRAGGRLVLVLDPAPSEPGEYTIDLLPAGVEEPAQSYIFRLERGDSQVE